MGEVGKLELEDYGIPDEDYEALLEAMGEGGGGLAGAELEATLEPSLLQAARDGLFRAQSVAEPLLEGLGAAEAGAKEPRLLETGEKGRVLLRASELRPLVRRLRASPPDGDVFPEDPEELFPALHKALLRRFVCVPTAQLRLILDDEADDTAADTNSDGQPDPDPPLSQANNDSDSGKEEEGSSEPSAKRRKEHSSSSSDGDSADSASDNSPDTPDPAKDADQ